ncbi:MAG: glycosyltransferase family 2 protein [Clostridiaceae bacterium]
MFEYPKTAIIILNFNSYNQTIECIESVKNITYPNYEIIVVDNNSKDDSLQLIKSSFPGIILLKSEDNLGYASGNNLGIKYALDENIEYICILNNDAAVDKNFLQPVIKTLIDDKKAAAAGPSICYYGQDDIIQAMGGNINLYTGLSSLKFKGKKHSEIKESLISVDYLGGACFVVKADILKKIGLIPENYFLFYEETEFFLNIKRQGYRLISVRDSKVYHKVSGTISKYKGLSYFFLNRNRILFVRRNAKLYHKFFFFFYIIIETIGRMILRGELSLFKYYYEGLKADKNKINKDEIKKFIKN